MIVHRIQPNTFRCIVSSNEDGVYYLTKGRHSDCWFVMQSGAVVDDADSKYEGLELIRKYGELQ